MDGKQNESKDDFDTEENNRKRMKKDSSSPQFDMKPSKSSYYEGKLILAPMVRANSLPFRLLCLRQGAHLVYSEELIDHRVVTCKRIENKLLGTIDLVDKDGRVIFRTCDEEKGRIVFQLGSNDPERALKAAKLISHDVMGIDFNFGCPKKFSIAGGMGAALLEEPEKIKALLTSCVNGLDVPITCKIRLLPKLEDTLKLVKMIESCGVSAIAVHGRTKDQRPTHDNDIEALRAISEILTIPLIANGESNNIKTHDDVMRFLLHTKASSVMIGRAAMKNPSIFKADTHNDYGNSKQHECIKNDTVELGDKWNTCSSSPKIYHPGIEIQANDVREFNESKDSDASSCNSIVQEYVKLAVRYDNHPSNVKYSLQSLLSSRDNRLSKEFSASLHRANSLETICDLFKLARLKSNIASARCNEINKTSLTTD